MCIHFISLILCSLSLSESVLVVGSVGLQLSTVRWCGYTTTVFIPHTLVGDVIINEAVTMVIAADSQSNYTELNALAGVMSTCTRRPGLELYTRTIQMAPTRRWVLTRESTVYRHVLFNSILRSSLAVVSPDINKGRSNFPVHWQIYTTTL